ncbi:proteasome assembly chaperone 3 isoform X3 [Zea mays]|uniref:proteasome assembly chaperone 3 isoform X3 n=1 Tax=Zea mays TaxID=4577 RepID=UPI0004DE834D|nr:proteasome assembly chaperone 3 isoform X3 [Zea mays]XP_035820179.1 proteasome assembly chaperone 3 isoform X3 [Zea mays]
MEVPMNSTQSGPHFPVQHQSLSLDIKGNKTDIVISKYEDTFLLIVAQIGCMGTILAAKKDESVFSDPTYNVSVLFGKRNEPLLQACARQLIEHISGSARSLVISLGLKDHSQGTLKDIIVAVIENRLW